MSENQRFLYVDGKAVPVSEEVYQAYQYYVRKEEYFTYDLKAEKFTCDQEAQTAAFVPSREDSYERLLETERQFAADETSPEDQALSSTWFQTLMRSLNNEERQIINLLYVLCKTEREACTAMGLKLSTFQRRRNALLKKLREILQKNF